MDSRAVRTSSRLGSLTCLFHKLALEILGLLGIKGRKVLLPGKLFKKVNGFPVGINGAPLLMRPMQQGILIFFL